MEHLTKRSGLIMTLIVAGMFSLTGCGKTDESEIAEPTRVGVAIKDSLDARNARRKLAEDIAKFLFGKYTPKETERIADRLIEQLKKNNVSLAGLGFPEDAIDKRVKKTYTEEARLLFALSKGYSMTEKVTCDIQEDASRLWTIDSTPIGTADSNYHANQRGSITDFYPLKWRNEMFNKGTPSVDEVQLMAGELVDAVKHGTVSESELLQMLPEKDRNICGVETLVRKITYIHYYADMIYAVMNGKQGEATVGSIIKEIQNAVKKGIVTWEEIGLRSEDELVSITRTTEKQ